MIGDGKWLVPLGALGLGIFDSCFDKIIVQ